jgi:signal transduction histidine kinase
MKVLLYLLIPSIAKPYLVSAYCINLVVSMFCAISLYTIKKDYPWIRYLLWVFVLFTLQYALQTFFIIVFGDPPQSAWSSWSDFMGIAISTFFMLSARTLLDNKRKLPNSYIFLMGCALAATIIGIIIIQNPNRPNANYLLTVCDFVIDFFSAVSLCYFGLALIINTNFYKSRFGILVGLCIGLLYGGIHLVNPFRGQLGEILVALEWVHSLINTTQLKSLLSIAGTDREKLLTLEPNEMKYLLTAILIWLASIFKMFTFYIAYYNTTLENETIQQLRLKLRESIKDRKVYFSRSGILEAIGQNLQADGVKLYIRVPPEKKNDEINLTHLYSWSLNPVSKSSDEDDKEEYDKIVVKETPLPRLITILSEAETSNSGTPKIKSHFNLLLNRIFPKATVKEACTIHDNNVPIVYHSVPILYHGGLIGCLTIEKKGTQNLTYSAEQVCRVLSEDISVLAQFYREQKSLEILIDELNRNLRQKLLLPAGKNHQLDAASNSNGQAGSTPVSYSHYIIRLKNIIEDTIQQVLSPQKTCFQIDAGFYPFADSDLQDSIQSSHDSLNWKPEPYPCKSEEINNGEPIAYITLEYKENKDPLEQPSLGSFKANRDALILIVTKFFIAAIEQRLNLIRNELSIELTNKQSFDTWLETITKSIKEADLYGPVVYRPAIQSFEHCQKANSSAEDSEVVETLKEHFSRHHLSLARYTGLEPEVFIKTSNMVIVGIKLKRSQLILFVGIKRVKFSEEIHFDSPWRTFLIKLASVADNAGRRMITAQKMQRLKIERTKDIEDVKNANLLAAFTHQLFNQIENLDNSVVSSASEIFDLGMDKTIKEQIELQLASIRKEVENLRTSATQIRSVVKMSERPGNCNLWKILEGMANLFEPQLKGNIKIDITKASADIKIALHKDIVAMIFDGLIRNAIAAIKRKNTSRENGHTGTQTLSFINISTEKIEGENFIYCDIQDTGEGVAPNIIDSLFDFNVSSTSETGGWGLYLIRRILKTHGCSIKLKRPESGSTTFRISLPVYNQ